MNHTNQIDIHLSELEGFEQSSENKSPESMYLLIPLVYRNMSNIWEYIFSKQGFNPAVNQEVGTLLQVVDNEPEAVEFLNSSSLRIDGYMANSIHVSKNIFLLIRVDGVRNAFPFVKQGETLSCSGAKKITFRSALADIDWKKIEFYLAGKWISLSNYNVRKTIVNMSKLCTMSGIQVQYSNLVANKNIKVLSKRLIA